MGHTFTVQFPVPLDILASLEVFRRAGDDGIDRWDGHTLVRTARVGDEVIPFTKSCQDAPLLAVGRNGILVRGFGGQIPPT